MGGDGADRRCCDSDRHLPHDGGGGPRPHDIGTSSIGDRPASRDYRHHRSADHPTADRDGHRPGLRSRAGHHRRSRAGRRLSRGHDLEFLRLSGPRQLGPVTDSDGCLVPAVLCHPALPRGHRFFLLARRSTRSRGAGQGTRRPADPSRCPSDSSGHAPSPLATRRDRETRSGPAAGEFDRSGGSGDLGRLRPVGLHGRRHRGIVHGSGCVHSPSPWLPATVSPGLPAGPRPTG